MNSSNALVSSAVPRTLSVVIPAFNAEGWIGGCIRRVMRAADIGEIEISELIVVDDGSTDGTVAEVDAVSIECGSKIDLCSQPNQGRLAARTSGLERATGDMVLFIDTRVHLDELALGFAFAQLDDPTRRVWTAHTTANTDFSPIAGFWQAIEHVAWRRYFKKPSTTSFGMMEFDFYPKGTTALIGPRQMLTDAFDAFAPTVADWHKVNDDTAVLRWVAERTPINISPEYSSVYNARTTLSAFLRHAEHRGTVLIDGYLRPSARFAGPIVAVLAATPVGLWFFVRHPLKAIGLGVAGSVAAGAGVRALGANGHDSRVLATYAMPFGVAYLTGMWRGVVLRVQWLLAHRREGRSS